jgi:hypothetical protein
LTYTTHEHTNGWAQTTILDDCANMIMLKYTINKQYTSRTFYGLPWPAPPPQHCQPCHQQQPAPLQAAEGPPAPHQHASQGATCSSNGRQQPRKGRQQDHQQQLRFSNPKAPGGAGST